MLLAQVKGHVVSTAKVDNLNGRTLLLVEVVTVRPDGLHGTGRDLVCVDAVGAGKTRPPFLSRPAFPFRRGVHCQGVLRSIFIDFCVELCRISVENASPTGNFRHKFDTN